MQKSFTASNQSLFTVNPAKGITTQARPTATSYSSLAHQQSFSTMSARQNVARMAMPTSQATMMGARVPASQVNMSLGSSAAVQGKRDFASLVQRPRAGPTAMKMGGAMPAAAPQKTGGFLSTFTNMLAGPVAQARVSRTAVKMSAAPSGSAGFSSGSAQRRVAKSLVQEMTAEEREEFNKLPSIDLDDLECVHYLQTISEGWAFPLERFMNEQELLESMNMNTITDKNGEKHILSVPITQHVTAEQKEKLEGQDRIAIRCAAISPDVLAVIEKPVFFENRKEEIATKTFGTRSKLHPKIARMEEQGDWLVSGESMRFTQRIKYNDKQLIMPQQSGKNFPIIAQVKAREIIDSRGNPTVEADVVLADGSTFRAAVPSGASTGIYEALELRDQDKGRFLGKGCLQAVSNINEIISPALQGMNVLNQEEIDRYMVEQLDGTQNEWGWCKQKLGANAILAVSLGVARAGAACQGIPLYQYIAKLAGKPEDKFIMPVPSLNIINGGAHAGNDLEMQEFMILPTGASSFKESLQIGIEVYHSLSKLLKKKFGLSAGNVGDEGGFGAPQIRDEIHTLEIIMEALKNSGHEGKVDIGLDVAASEFYDADKKIYNFSQKTGKNDRLYTPEQTLDLYANLCEKYPMVSIEDPFDQDDFDAYIKMTQRLGDKIQIVGDDLLVTNPKRVKAGIDQKMCNALLLKVNQIGSVTEAIEASNMSQAAGWGVMVSHRSGETEDNFIGDLVCGLGTGEIKSGAPCRSDRLAKYNQILRIEEELGDKAVFAGKAFRDPSALLE